MSALIKDLLGKVRHHPQMKFDTLDIQVESLIAFAYGLGYSPRIIGSRGQSGEFGFIRYKGLRPQNLSFEEILSLHNNSVGSTLWPHMGIYVGDLLRAENSKTVETVGLYRVKADKRLYTTKQYVKLTKGV